MIHPRRDDSDLMAAKSEFRCDLGGDSSPSATDGWILVAEEEDFHLVTSGAPNRANHSP
jgi:hypothetical protein